MCRDGAGQFCEFKLSASYGTKPGQGPLPPWGTLWHYSLVPDFSKSGTGTGESPRPTPRFRTNRGRGRGSVPAPGKIGDGRPVPVPGQIGDGDGDGDRGVRALTECSECADFCHGGIPGRARNPRCAHRSPPPTPPPISPGVGVGVPPPICRKSGAHPHPHPRFAGDRGSNYWSIPAGAGSYSKCPQCGLPVARAHHTVTSMLVELAVRVPL